MHFIFAFLCSFCLTRVTITNGQTYYVGAPYDIKLNKCNQYDDDHYFEQHHIGLVSVEREIGNRKNARNETSVQHFFCYMCRMQLSICIARLIEKDETLVGFVSEYRKQSCVRTLVLVFIVFVQTRPFCSFFSYSAINK